MNNIPNCKFMVNHNVRIKDLDLRGRVDRITWNGYFWIVTVEYWFNADKKTVHLLEHEVEL